MQYLSATLLVFVLLSCQQPARPPATPTGAAVKRQTDSTLPISSPVKAAATTGSPGKGQQAVSSFIPSGYSILDTASGNLNLDQYPDKILVLKKDGEEKSSDVVEHPEKRPLLILTGQADKTYKLAAQSDNVVLCVDCGGVMGDPYMDIVIKNGYFSVEQSGGSSQRWTRTTTFRYATADSTWLLYKDGHGNYETSAPGKVETKIYTAKNFGKVPVSKFNVYKDQ